MFPIQVVVGKKLPEDENIWLKNLNKSKLSINTLQKMRVLKMNIGKEINAGAYFHAIFMAKGDLLEEAEKMGKSSLTELMEDMGLIQEWKNQGIDITLTIIKMLKENVPPERIAEELKIPLDKIMLIKLTL